MYGGDNSEIHHHSSNIHIGKVTFSQVSAKKALLRRNTLGLGGIKPKISQDILEISQKQFLSENKERQMATAENQNIFLSGVNHTFATVIDNDSKNKHVNGAKVQIDASKNEKVRILN